MAKEENEMVKILQDVGLEEVKDNFIRERITPGIVQQLTKEDLNLLGVERLGDQKRLRAACTPSSGSAVLDEVRRVMGGCRGSSSGPGASPAVSFNPNFIVNRSKRKPSSKGKKKMEKSLFKNFSVIEYDSNFEKQFTVKCSHYILSGIVELSPNDDEEAIRKSIVSVINNSDETLTLEPNDFQFVKRSGHIFRIPDVAPGFNFDMNALKALIGQGDIYIRLTKDISSKENLDSRPSSPNAAVSDNLSLRQGAPVEPNRRPGLSLSSPPSYAAMGNDNISRQNSSEAPVHPSRRMRLSLSSPSTSYAANSDNISSRQMPSEAPIQPNHPSISTSSTEVFNDNVVDLTSDNSDYSVHSPVNKKSKSDAVPCTSDDLYSMFPNVQRSQVDLVMGFVDGDSALAIDALLDTVDIGILLSAVGDTKLLGERSRIIVKKDSVLLDAFSYYKKSTVDMSRPISVIYDGMPAVDAGGPKRQFFTDTLVALKDSHGLFEGSNHRLLPVYSTGIIASGLLKVLGRIIVHSLLQEGPGFPLFAPCIYHYIVSGSVEDSLQYAEIRDMPPSFVDMMSKLLDATTDDDIAGVSQMEEFERLQNETACRRLLSLSNKHQIAHEFFIHEAILCRQLAIDQLCCGLESLGFLSLVRALPGVMKSCFTYEAQCLTADRLVSILKLPNSTPVESTASKPLIEVLQDLTDEELKKFLRFVSGSQLLPPDGYSIGIIVRFYPHLKGISASTCSLELSLPPVTTKESMNALIHVALEDMDFNTV